VAGPANGFLYLSQFIRHLLDLLLFQELGCPIGL
jgi:hypothetical protein